MKSTKTQKYVYWKWVLLNNHTKKVSKETKRNIIAVHNPILDTMYRYDIDKKEVIKTNWEGLDWLFKNCLADFINLDNVESFYKSLPKQKKEIFWGCAVKSLTKQTIKRIQENEDNIDRI